MWPESQRNRISNKIATCLMEFIKTKANEGKKKYHCIPITVGSESQQKYCMHTVQKKYNNNNNDFI